MADKVILDLKYEARDVPQRLTSPKAIDAWFDKKTQGLNRFQTRGPAQAVGDPGGTHERG